MDLHSGETIVFEGHPSWRGVLSFYVKNIAADLVIAAVLWFAWSQVYAVLVFGLLVAGTIFVGFILRVATVYTITNERLRIRTGLISKRVQQTDINRVQNVNTSQGPLERVMRVGKVDFDTAGTDDASFTFRGIANPEEIVAAVDRAKRNSPSSPASEQGL
ncbi:MAG: PH domain-containing protein [Thermoleophilaceae bacterium]|nr:PH domain-containing protein [Thermoleophilaceae bacterium]